MPTVAILIFPGVQALDVTGPMDVFAEANSFLPPERQYSIEVLGTQDGLMRCSNGLPLAAHRHYALAACFPLARVDADSLYLHDGTLVSSAGVTAGIDLSLSLLAIDGGAALALQVARRLVVYTQRQGGQSQFSPYLTPMPDAASPVAQARQYVLDHLADHLSVDTLARQVTMSARNFARVFVRELGVTPAHFIESARLDAARALLEASDEPLKTIAWRCGLGSADQLRTVFRRRLGVSATQYRLNFSSRDA